MKAKKMQDETLVAIIKAQRRNSLGIEGDLSNERAEAYNRYHGRPYGNEQEGRSQVVSKDLAEAVGWCMPPIMKVFTSSGNVAEFIANGDDDEAGAKQETDYVNNEIMRSNPGWLVLYDCIKDALILKNGYVKHFWAEEEVVSEKEFTGLTVEGLQMVLAKIESSDVDVEIVGQEETVDDFGQSFFDVKLKATEKKGRLVVEAVPCEEVRVSNRCRGSLQTSPFTEHVTKKFRSDLIEMGMDADFVYSLPSYAGELENDTESRARDSVEDESNNESNSFTDRSMDEIEYCEAYIRVDYDGDGVAELRKVVTCANQIPPGEEWNEMIEAVPMTSWQALRIPHRHIGESLNDDIEDIALIKTTLQRQLLDNVYRTNDNQWVLNENANVSDFLQSLPGGIKRVEGTDPVQNSVMAVQTTNIAGNILPVIGYLDDVMDNRSGANKMAAGLNADVMKDSTKGAYIEGLNRASQKIEMMIRLLAETGLKETVIQCHGILLRHQDFKKKVKLAGEYVEVDPTTWEDRNAMVVKVGIGSGTEDERRMKMMIISELQDKLLPMGLVGEKQAKAMFDEVADALGFTNPDKYIMTPGSEEHQAFTQMKQQQAQQAQQSNMLADAEKVKGQFEVMKTQSNLQMAALKEQFDQKLETLKLRYEAQNNEAQRNYDAQALKAQLASKEAIESMKAEVQLFLEGTKADLGPSGFGAMPNTDGM